MILPISVSRLGSGICASLVRVILERRSTDQRQSYEKVKMCQHHGVKFHVGLFLKSRTILKFSNPPKVV